MPSWVPELTGCHLVGALLGPYSKMGDSLSTLARGPLLPHHLEGPVWVLRESPRETEP